MPIQINNQTLELDGIQSILVSDIEPDTDTEYFVRILTFFDQPATSQNRSPILTLKLYGGSQSTNDKSELEIQTPSLEFAWLIAPFLGALMYGHELFSTAASLMA